MESLSRVVIWPVIVASYASVFAAAAHWLTDTWSGLASLGIWFAVLVGVPGLIGYAGSLWWRNRIYGIGRVEAYFCFSLPVVLLALAGLVVAAGRR